MASPTENERFLARMLLSCYSNQHDITGEELQRLQDIAGPPAQPTGYTLQPSEIFVTQELIDNQRKKGPK